jgi:hypothetical protein
VDVDTAQTQDGDTITIARNIDAGLSPQANGILAGLWNRNWSPFYTMERDNAINTVLGPEEEVQRRVGMSKTKGSEFGSIVAMSSSLSGKQSKLATDSSEATVAIHSNREGLEQSFKTLADNSANAIRALQKTNLSEPVFVNGTIVMKERRITFAEAESLVKHQNTLEREMASKIAVVGVNAIPK